MAHSKHLGPPIASADLNRTQLFHVWFATKSRKWLLQGDILDAAREEFAAIATESGIRLVEYEAIVDHVHLLLESTKADLPKAINYLKGTSARHLFARFPELKLDAHTLRFWQTGYGSKVVPPEAVAATRHYIRTQWDRLEDYARPPRHDRLAR